jgi:ribonuclease HI
MVSRYLVDVREAMGLLVAIEWLKEMEFKQAIFSLDLKAVVDAFNSPKLDRT